MQLLEELVSELQLTDPVSSGVTHMDNPPYYRITSSYKIPSVTSGENLVHTVCFVSGFFFFLFFLSFFFLSPLLFMAAPSAYGGSQARG